VHAYEGLPAEALSRGVELLASLGAETLLVTNAAGGLRPDMQSGELVVVNDHLDFVAKPWTRPLADGESELRPRHRTFYDPDLVARSLEAAARAGVPARPGVYAYFLGPNYETRAEYRMLRRLGADAVGMSTVPEVVAAASLGLAVAAVSVVTNVARPDALDPTDADEVCQLAGRGADGVWAIVEALLGRVPMGAFA
jgi:purine-nucleoside phosphorylase